LLRARRKARIKPFSPRANSVLWLRRESNYRGIVVDLFSLDERIRKLCAKLATAEGPELEKLLAELRGALQEHARAVRQIATRTLARMREKSSDKVA